jgi:sugar (pentulose or hexulose) kinase
MGACHVAIDIGASSGRHIVGQVVDGRMELTEVYRFENGLSRKDGHLCWDIDALAENVIAGLAAAKEAGCKFCLASDAQKPDDLQRIVPENAEYIIDAIGLTVEDIALPVNRI